LHKPNEIVSWCSAQAKSDTKAINQGARPSVRPIKQQQPVHSCTERTGRPSRALHLNETVNSAFNKSIAAALVRYIVKPWFKNA
jgi:hypothetical protein